MPLISSFSKYLLGFIIVISIASVYHETPQPIEEQELDFKINPKDYENGDMKFCMQFFDRDSSRITFDKQQTIKKLYDNHTIPPFHELDLYNIRKNRTEEDQPYFTVISKVVYQINKPIQFFNEKRLTNIDFLRKTLPSYKLSQLKKNTYHMEGTMFAPSFDFTITPYLKPFTNPNLPNQKRLKAIKKILQQYSDLDVDPSILTIHHNYNFGTVLWQKTNKMSVALTAYYPIGNKTLITVHTLNLTHNFPPKIVGGEKAMQDIIIESMQELIYETRKACKTSNS